MKPETWFREVNFEAHIAPFWSASLSFFNNIAFAFCQVFWGDVEYGGFAGKWKSEYIVKREAKSKIFMNFRMDSESEIRNISRDIEQKWGALGGGWAHAGERLPENGGGPIYSS